MSFFVWNASFNASKEFFKNRIKNLKILLLFGNSAIKKLIINFYKINSTVKFFMLSVIKQYLSWLKIPILMCWTDFLKMGSEICDLRYFFFCALCDGQKYEAITYNDIFTTTIMINDNDFSNYLTFFGLFLFLECWKCLTFCSGTAQYQAPAMTPSGKEPAGQLEQNKT